MIDIGFSLTQSSPWVQVPMVLAFALPAAGIAAVLWVVVAWGVSTDLFGMRP